MNLKQLIKKHKFDWVYSKITEENFPNTRRLKEYKLFYFDRAISSEDVIKNMEYEGYVPANVYELLEWKDWNTKDFVVALGQIWRSPDGDFRVAFLFRDDSERRLDLGWFDVGWRGPCRFLAVRKYPLDPKTLDPNSLLDTLEIKINGIVYVPKKYPTLPKCTCVCHQPEVTEDRDDLKVHNLRSTIKK